MILIIYYGSIYALLLCSRPAASLRGVQTSISKALTSQQLKIITNEGSIWRKDNQRRYIVSEAPSSTYEQSQNSRNSSYTGLLVHYLTQNVKPKFRLCVNVISKIIERDGPNAAIRLSESLESSISAESFRMAKNALLSALVLQRQTEAASLHLKRLLQQQNGHWQLDVAVVADLLQLYMAADTDRDSTILRRQYKRRALEASMIYANVMDVQTQSQSPISESQVLWRSSAQESSYTSPEMLLTPPSAAAADRIHEYGARALAVSRDWDRAVLAISCIGEKHLATDALISFSFKLLERLVKFGVKSGHAVGGAVEIESSVITASYVKSDIESCNRGSCSLALELALLQPLHLLPIDSPLLQSCLLLLGSSSAHADRLTASLEDISFRRSITVNTPSLIADQITLSTESFSVRVGPMLLQRLFLSGYNLSQLIVAVTLIWGQSGSGSSSGHFAGAGDCTLTDGASPSEATEQETSANPVLDAISNILRIACLSRDVRSNMLTNDSIDSSVTAAVDVLAFDIAFASEVATLPSVISGALSATTSTSTSELIDALNPCLHLLFLSSQLTDSTSQNKTKSNNPTSSLICDTLQAAADQTWRGSALPVQAWYPDADILADALQLPIRLTNDSRELRLLAIFQEVTGIILKECDVPAAFIISALFRCGISAHICNHIRSYLREASLIVLRLLYRISLVPN